MRLVDGDERDIQLARERAEAVGQQPLRRDVEKLVRAVTCTAADLAQLVIRHGAVDAPGGDTCVLERHDLILHKRDQR